MRRHLIAAAMAVALAGCAATPTAPPQLDLPAASADPVKAAALTRWWTAFGDPTLDKLVDEALANNLDLRAAITRIDFARAQVLLASADLYPNVDLAVGASRTRSTERATNPLPEGFSPYSNDFRVGLQLSYQVDLWSKFRTATRAAQADLLATQYASETVRTTIAADTTRFYFNLLAADAQLSVLEDTLKSRVETVELQQARWDAGLIGDFDLRSAEAERAAIQADIAFARRVVTEYESALAVLLGRSPREVFSPTLARSVAMTWGATVPTIPAGLPSDLLARRPDIQTTEAQLAAANMRIDVARADYFPQLTLTGLLGTEAGALKNLFSGPSLIWGIGASLLQPLFGLQAIDANVTAQTARRNELVITYSKTVQTAFREVHDALSANDLTRAALAAQSERKDKLSQVLELSNLRYNSGYSPYLEVLDSQRQLLQAQTLQIIAARNVRLAVVDLATALGGGWDMDAVTPATSLVGPGSGAARPDRPF
ncbi:MAG: efflux transporter outer membrane subunit [Casimicrobiaceae bacterium]